MATKPPNNERVAVLETKVDNLKEGIDTLRETLTSTHVQMMAQLDQVRADNSAEHSKVMEQLNGLIEFKNKWVWIGGLAVSIIGPVVVTLINHYLKNV